MPEVLFYHMERAGLDDVLPGLLEKTRERRWRALVRVGSAERLEDLDARLWTYREESFLAHGTDRENRRRDMPILLTTEDENCNDANVFFYADGTMPVDWSAPRFEGVIRVVVLFDGRDAAAMENAREHWKMARAAGYEATYWQQSASGGWEKRA